MSKRVMGKASFCNIQDLKGNIQVYVARDSIGEDLTKILRKWISVISSDKGKLSQQRPVRSPFMQTK